MSKTNARHPRQRTHVDEPDPWVAEFTHDVLEAALNAMMPPALLKPGRFRAPDKLLAMLGTAGRKPNYAE